MRNSNGDVTWEGKDNRKVNFSNQFAPDAIVNIEDEKYDKYKLLFLLKENEQAKEFINIFSNIGGANDSE